MHHEINTSHSNVPRTKHFGTIHVVSFKLVQQALCTLCARAVSVSISSPNIKYLVQQSNRRAVCADDRKKGKSNANRPLRSMPHPLCMLCSQIKQKRLVLNSIETNRKQQNVDNPWTKWWTSIFFLSTKRNGSSKIIICFWRHKVTDIKAHPWPFCWVSFFGAMALRLQLFGVAFFLGQVDTPLSLLAAVLVVGGVSATKA